MSKAPNLKTGEVLFNIPEKKTVKVRRKFPGMFKCSGVK